MNYASAQSRIPACEVTTGLYIYADSRWTPVVEAVTVGTLTTITVEARAEPLAFHPDDAVDVCTPSTAG